MASMAMSDKRQTQLITRNTAMAALLLVVAGILQAGLPARQKAERTDWREQARAALAQTSGELRVPGLEQPVEVLRDPWGVAHIYAQTQHDLFFAQGFVAAQDRLWQLDLWRRKAEGRLAEVFGAEFVERDRYARLLRYRGDWDAEWQSYSPDAKEITEAFVAGINAYIDSIGERLPVEFQMLGYRPGKWTPEVCVSRLAAYPMTGNAEDERFRAEMVRRLGAKRAAQLFPTDPARSLAPPKGLDLEGVDASVLAGVDAASSGVYVKLDEGSNNWALAGSRTASGKPILANDPHRALQLPSLRYLVHLVGPGWNVIGAGEPALPGISIGHNERIAFGLTIFAADQQDIVVLQTDAADANRYRVPRSASGERTQAMTVVEEEIPVRGEAQPRTVQLKYAHGNPVIHEDPARRRAYALRWVGTEAGTAGYFAGMAISRAQNWKEFREALQRWKLPPENFVYADIEGNIGYQAAGLVPNRVGHDGILPLPQERLAGTWRGFLTLDDLPHEYNPERGSTATANHKTIPPDEKRAIGFEWSSPYRIERIREALAEAKKHTVADSQRLQTDVVSLPARELLELLPFVPHSGPRRARAVEFLRVWNGEMDRESPEAALYAVWVDRLRERVFVPHVPPDLWQGARGNISLPTLLAVLEDPENPLCGYACRSDALGNALDDAVAFLERRQGSNWDDWRWGRLHTAEFTHPLGATERGAWLNRGPVERSGDRYTVNAASGGGFRQSSGASFRQVIDLADWDRSVASNVPGQSGQPESPHYDDLLQLWKDDRYFPLLYTRAAIEKQARQKLILNPQ